MMESKMSFSFAKGIAILICDYTGRLLEESCDLFGTGQTERMNELRRRSQFAGELAREVRQEYRGQP